MAKIKNHRRWVTLHLATAGACVVSAFLTHPDGPFGLYGLSILWGMAAWNGLLAFRHAQLAEAQLEDGD